VSNCEQFRDLIEAYALGALDPEERATFEAHLATDCAECAKKVDEARWLVSQLAYAAPEATPSEMLKGRLLKTVRTEAQTRAGAAAVADEEPGEAGRSGGAIPFWIWATIAALLLFAVYSAWNTYRLDREIRAANDRATALLEAREKMQKELLMAKREAMIMTDPSSHKIALWGEHAHPETLEAKWHAQYGLCVMGEKVPMPSENHVLQVWFIPKGEGKKPMPSMMVKPDANGKLMFVISNPPEPMDDTKAIAITEEPEGGSGWPTTPILWSGNVTGGESEK
jgi:anti-sigma-K factor RskA